ncbi:MAG: beta-Ala-His dipeptidase [Holdemanella sp.]|nr:beta-Ala-His dipeptidase [Holdemanella sp.]
MLNTDTLINYYFKQISNIPRGSFNEKGISDYLVQFAKEKKLKYIQDKLNNVIIFKDASAGYENHAPLMLQGHMDMVAEKELDSSHDFTCDPLELIVEGNVLHANRTTLGADDGCGLCYMLAILADDTLKHPPLECVFTVQEEVGLFGAFGLDMTVIKSKRMIGLDSGNEGTTCTTSSGGNDTILTKEIHREARDGKAYLVRVDGLLGGHSGGCIAMGRGNANILLARILYECLLEGIDLQVISINGGLKDNAICRSSEAKIICSSNLLISTIQRMEKEIKEELYESDRDVFVEMKEIEKEACMTKKDTEDILSLLYSVPNGCLEMSQSIPDLPVLSLNLGILKTLEDKVILHFSIRSPLSSRRNTLSNKLICIGKAYGATGVCESDYPGWNYDPDSKMRNLLKTYFKETTGKDLIEMATHGGLETGIFKGKIKELDIVTLGPDMDDIHTPQERLYLDSYERVYKQLIGFIETL